MNSKKLTILLLAILLPLAADASLRSRRANVYEIDRYPEARGSRDGIVIVYEHVLFIPGHWEEAEVPVWKWDPEVKRMVIVEHQLTRIWVPSHDEVWHTTRWYPR